MGIFSDKVDIHDMGLLSDKGLFNVELLVRVFAVSDLSTSGLKATVR
jgi:hypothetical protein